MIKTIFKLFLILLLFNACGTTSEGGGTSISNPPTVPSNSIIPDFEENIPETAVTDTDSTETESLITSDWDDTLFLTGPASAWSSLFLNGPITISRNLRRVLRTWGEAVSTKIAEDPNFTLSSTPQSFIVQNKRLLGVMKTWRVSIRATDERHIKVVVRNTEDNKIWAYYLFKTDENGDPIKGVFSFVNPDKLEFNAPSGLRFAAIAFDFSDTATNKMSFTIDVFNSQIDRFAIFFISYQCDISTKDCVGQFLPINSQAPEREFGSPSVRYSYNDSSKEVCIETATYGDDNVTFGETQMFTGPEEPQDDDVSEGSCTVATPFWNERIFRPRDFPDRFGDDNDGGFAGHIRGDGSSDTPWETEIGNNTFENWLLGEFESD